MTMRHSNLLRLIPGVMLLAACSTGEQGSASAATPAASKTPGVETPAPGGKVVVVEMVTDGDGNYFTPADFTVKRGDVIRFTLRAGVHNASFVEDKNPGITGLPASTPFLQLPGQTYDVKIDMAPGTYYYHCDPHALLGMIGHITVTE